MFNPFKRKPTKLPEVAPITTPTYTPPMPTVKKPKEGQCLYTVGTTTDGQTVLRLASEDGYTSMTLTMNNAATYQMIRMLKATLPEVNEDAETNSISD